MMDRKIKFRVWDKLEREMIGDNMHVIGESLCCGRIENWIRNHDYEKPFLERYNDMVLMEWTGMQDKEGKDIYEGDIMEWNGKKSLIIFKGGETNDLTGWSQFMGFVPEIIYDGTIKSFLMSKAKVIGNKFEDPGYLAPELLED